MLNPNNGAWSTTDAYAPGEGWAFDATTNTWSASLGSGATITLPTKGQADANNHLVKNGQVSRAGYILDGWTTTIGGTLIKEAIYEMPIGALTLYAHWSPLSVSYTVSHVKVHGDGTTELMWKYETEGNVSANAASSSIPRITRRQQTQASRLSATRATTLSTAPRMP